MRARTVQTWIARRSGVRRRLERVCTSSLLVVLVVTTKHALEEAARFARRPKAQCAKMWQAQSHVAVSPLESLAKKHAKHVSQLRQKVPARPWPMAIVVERTLQPRARLHPDNAKTFNHGQGLVVGHQWTTSVVILNAMLIPLRPIPL